MVTPPRHSTGGLQVPFPTRRPAVAAGLWLFCCLCRASSLDAQACEDRVPFGFILEATLTDRFNGAKAGEEVVMDETSPRHFAVLQLWDAHGLPVCWREVTFESHAPDQVDFIEETGATNGDGIVANVLVRKVGASSVQTEFTVRTEDGIEGTFGLRGVSWITDASPINFIADPLEEFFGPLQQFSGFVHNFASDLRTGFEVRAWAIDPRIAEPGNLLATDEFHWPSHAQKVIGTVTARSPGQTLFLVDTIEPSTYRAEIRGDIHPLFIRGDCNLDDLVDLADAVFELDALFRGGAPFRLHEACNPNDDGSVDIADAIHLLSHLFRGGPAPPPPFPGKDRDPDPP